MEEFKEKIKEYIKTPIGKVILGVAIAVVIFIAATITIVLRVSDRNSTLPNIDEIVTEVVPPSDVFIPEIPTDVNYILIDDLFAGSFEGGYWNSVMAQEATDLLPIRQISQEEMVEKREYYEFDRIKLSVEKEPILEVGGAEETGVYVEKIKEYLDKQYLGNIPIIIEDIAVIGDNTIIVASSSFDVTPEDKNALDYGVFKGIFAMTEENFVPLVFEGIGMEDISFQEVYEDVYEGPAEEEVESEGTEEVTEETEEEVAEGAEEQAPIAVTQVVKYVPQIDYSRFAFELVGIYDINGDKHIDICIKREWANEFEILVYTRRLDRYKMVLYNKIDKASLIVEEEVAEEVDATQEGEAEDGAEVESEDAPEEEQPPTEGEPSVNEEESLPIEE